MISADAKSIRLDEGDHRNDIIDAVSSEGSGIARVI